MKLRLPVEEFTTPNPITTSEDTPFAEVLRLMIEHGVRHLPVVRDNEVIGVVSDRDLRIARGLSAEHKIQVRAADVMSGDPVSVLADTPLDEVAFTMSDRKIGSVIVNESDGSFLGIFTVTDALNALIEITRASSKG
ncbi:MAG TPA: CBS domain-containing protein [Burkholderiaceae bacterium]|nr:CBS domain-containing protein [Burkholderiaceae bacterium]